MRKIAILTLYYKNFNYGGILQSYALQKVIENMGFDAKQISYVMESNIEGWNSVKWKMRKKIARIYHYIRYGNWMKKFEQRREKISNFSRKIPHTAVVTVSDIGNLSNDFDCFVCGSDQIWNPIGWQPTFFWDFLPEDKPRFSYAASVARDKLTKQQLEFMRKYLIKFNVISVRENNTTEMLNKNYKDLNVYTMPDPVILLSRKQWEAVVKTFPIKEKYILAYFLGNDITNRDKAIRYAGRHKLKIIFVSYINKNDYIWEKNNKDSLAPVMGIEDFVSGIANAELVLTDSFHGAVFSSIFNIPFYVMSRFKKNDQLSMNSRLETLLNDLGIPNRNCDDIEKHENYKWKKEEIDSINCNLSRLRSKGISFLESTFTKLHLM